MDSRQDKKKESKLADLLTTYMYWASSSNFAHPRDAKNGNWLHTVQNPEPVDPPRPRRRRTSSLGIHSSRLQTALDVLPPRTHSDTGSTESGGLMLFKNRVRASHGKGGGEDGDPRVPQTSVEGSTSTIRVTDERRTQRAYVHNPEKPPLLILYQNAGRNYCQSLYDDSLWVGSRCARSRPRISTPARSPV